MEKRAICHLQIPCLQVERPINFAGIIACRMIRLLDKGSILGRRIRDCVRSLQ